MSGRPRLGFIGIGIMGSQAVLRLRERGFEVAVWNLEPERYALVEPAGAVPKASPAEVAAASDIALMCVLDGPAVENCCFGRGGLAACEGGAALVVDMSTINPDTTIDVAGRLREANGMRWVDAPVSGGPQAARNGTLTVMAGGDPADIERAKPVMEALAANFTRMGPLGAGQTTKILNQAIVGVGYVLMAEALALAECAGLDAAKLPDCLKGGHADSSLLQRLYPQMQQRDFDPPRGYARQLNKDLKNVKAFARGLGLELPVVEAAVARYADYVAQGNEMKDGASIARLYEKGRSR
jgi:3-hydroxyisobutyrate dehydrogenase